MTSASRSLFGLTTVAIYVLASLLAGLAHAPPPGQLPVAAGDAAALAAALCGHGSAPDDRSGAPLRPLGACDACVLMAAANLPPAGPVMPGRVFAWISADPHSEAPAPPRPAVARPASRGPPDSVA
jgi:hypothetical protein